MMPSVTGISRLDANAALNLLASGESEGWLEAARLVVAYFRDLPAVSAVSAQVQTLSQRPNAKVAGHTSAGGNVTVETEERKEWDWSRGFPTARVGRFKVHKPEQGVLQFCHFWHTDLAAELAQGEEPTEYELLYDQRTEEPAAIGVTEERPVYHLGPIHVGAMYFRAFNAVEPDPFKKRRGITIKIGAKIG